MNLVLRAIISGLAAELLRQVSESIRDAVARREAERRRMARLQKDLTAVEKRVSQALMGLEALKGRTGELMRLSRNLENSKADALLVLMNAAMPEGYTAEREAGGVRWRTASEFGSINQGDPRHTVKDAWAHYRHDEGAAAGR